MNRLFSQLRVSVGAILQDWASHAAAERETGEGSRRAQLDALCGAVLDLAQASGEEIAEVERTCERVAAEHGRALAEAGLAEDLVFEETDLLRRAVWHYVQCAEADPNRAEEAIARVDAAITLATVSALRGYHARGTR